MAKTIVPLAVTIGLIYEREAETSTKIGFSARD